MMQVAVEPVQRLHLLFGLRREVCVGETLPYIINGDGRRVNHVFGKEAIVAQLVNKYLVRGEVGGELVNL